MNFVYVAIGGFFGAITRYAVGDWLQTNDGIPLGTLVINLIGCFLLGWFLAYAKRKSVRNDFILLIGTGFLGSFTTFSTFSVEAIRLLERSLTSIFFLYVVTTVVVGLFFTYIGYRLGSFEKVKGVAK